MDLLENLQKKKTKNKFLKAYDLEYSTQDQNREPDSCMGKEINLPSYQTHKIRKFT